MIALGLGFGDEGKGLTTSFLCSQVQNPIVVRFNGGHQAGHTVVHNGIRHVFSSFGAGTLQGVPTYWSKFCTFNPVAFMNEYAILKHEHGIEPIIYVDPLCPVTTPYDIAHNQRLENQRKHGSVGVGFGSTLYRHEQHYKLFVQDLLYDKILSEKLKNIESFYKFHGMKKLHPDKMDLFLLSVSRAKDIIRRTNKSLFHKYTPIFEGAQGIMLDQDFGFFPNVTRSNTTSKNAIHLIKENHRHDTRNMEVYYVTRTYLTRHGNGYLPNEGTDVGKSLTNNHLETNKSHKFQGEFRTAELDIDMMNYALECDHHYSSGFNKNLVITCFDQLRCDVDFLLKNLKFTFNKVYISQGDSMDKISLYK